MRTPRPGGQNARTQHRSIVRHGRSSPIGSPPGIEAAAYLDAFYGFAGDDDFDAPSGTLAAAALDQLRWAATRRRGRPKVRVFNPSADRHGWSSHHTIIQTITDDSPFIVDSVTMLVNRSTGGVLKNIHPTFRVDRDRSGKIHGLAAVGADGGGHAESWMHIEIPRIVDREQITQLKRDVESTLKDVRIAVQDWRPMLARVTDVIEQLERTRRKSDGRAREIREFMDWLAKNHFTFLGYCEYVRGKKGLEPRPDTGLGLLRESRGLQRIATGAAGMSPPRADRRHELSITKAPIRSTIHRPAPLDDVSIGLPAEHRSHRIEHRFVGLFTSTAYTEPPASIPVLRTKADSIVRLSGLDPASHQGKALQHILDTLPRDELLQASVAELKTMALAILALEGRRRIRLFVRLDSRGNFYACLIFLPGDHFRAATRRKIESILAAELGGTIADSRVTLTEASLARLEVTVAVEEAPQHMPDLERLNAALIDTATPWPDQVRNMLLDRYDETTALELHARFTERFPLAYQDTMSAERACRDIAALAELDAGTTALSTALEPAADERRLRFSVLKAGQSVPLYLVHPILENLGLRVVSESNYRLTTKGSELWIQDFELESPAPVDPAANDLAGRFQQCFAETLEQRIENDEFNSLVLTAGLDWKEANLLRACCKYLLQGRLRFSQRYMLQTLTRFPDLTRALVALFHARFDPDLAGKVRNRTAASSIKLIDAALERVVSLDDDRILRAFASVVRATLRTNFFQTGNGVAKDYISFKLDPSGIPDLPQPRPRFEVFVYARHVEGVHLRCGPIARGGIRWSDRREDFRTEVLGLMKAQQVKNTVIVPAGAKGGFVSKLLPEGDRAAQQAEVIRCYRTFLRGLLDITDNIVADRPVTPDRVIRRDDPDPYLVVAADKGTATFSDIANELSAEYGFWLGDAFASGGSAGYDHKKMGITARGAWESVKRHFRELGIDTQSEDFTVVGIGDMGGDVFGNGMLLSRHIRLLAAFNHQHIIVDPDPDPAASYAERRRLFKLPRSSWEDYDPQKLSAGGGVFRRDTKSIELSREARRALGVDRKSLSPPELIQAILRAPVDLLWNGGIGTYVRASSESDLDAGDPVNDSVRVTGADLRCRVIGEGGNLGLTQLGRVEYARAGGRLNTDFIDNSAGVDSSDREVNIKILLADAIAGNRLQPGRRNALLARMTDDVAALVLASNYAQTQALSTMAAHARDRMGEHARLIRLLESRGLLDRAIEFLPTDEQLEERLNRGEGLTRPELAVIMSYAKIELFESLIETDIPDEPHCASELLGYFPERLAKRFADLIPQHRLAREIVAMLIASSMTNRMGPFFALRTQEDTGADPAQVARAYATVRTLFGTRALWLEIEALDGRVRPDVQYECFFQASRMVRRAVYWHLHRHTQHLDISGTVAAMGPGVATVLSSLPDVLGGHALRRFERDTREYESLGLPAATARRIASLRVMTQALDVVELAVRFDIDPRTVACLHFELGRALRLDWIREQIEVLEPKHRWHATARGTLRESVGREQQALVTKLVTRPGKPDYDAALGDWLTRHSAQIGRMKRTFDEMRSGGNMDFATLSIALREVSRLRQ